MTAPLTVLLGPQRPTANLGAAIRDAGLGAKSFAVISAAWQEAEGDIDDVRALAGVPMTDLQLWRRAETVFEADPELTAAYRKRQDSLKELQRLYRLRLKQLAIAARHTFRADGDAEMLAAEQRHAIAQLRALDRHHLHRTEGIQRVFELAHNRENNIALAAQADDIASVIDANDALLIAGGNIVVLLNRIRLFGLVPLLARKPIVAWSAGAMVLGKRIVLYHDKMPHGRRDPEVLGSGLGLIDGHVVLSDTSNRLRQSEKLRIGVMSRRFAPDVCLALDSGARVEFRNGRIARSNAARRLARTGRIVRMRTS